MADCPEGVSPVLWKAYRLDEETCPGGKDCKCPLGTPKCLRTLVSWKSWDRLGKKEEEWLKEAEKSERRIPWEEPAGLINLGNTCYLASYLQLFFRLPPLREAVFAFQPPPEGCLAEGSRAASIAAFLSQLQCLWAQMLAGEEKVYSPEALVRTLQLDGQQQDAGEFGSLLLGLLEDSPGASGEAVAATVRSLFVGQTKTKMRCLGRGCERLGPAEDFRELRLSIGKDFDASLQAAFEPETLEDFRCGSCDGMGVERWSLLASAPPILAVQLNRYEFQRNTDSRKKISTALAYPRRLSLGSLPRSDDLSADVGLDYDLMGLLVHRGDAATAGHYFSLVADPLLRRWLRLDDQDYGKPSRAQMAQVCGEASGGGSIVKAIARGTYLLLYRRTDLAWAEPMKEAAEEDREGSGGEADEPTAKVSRMDSEDSSEESFQARVARTKLLSEIPPRLLRILEQEARRLNTEEAEVVAEIKDRLESAKERKERLRDLVEGLRLLPSDPPDELGFLPAKLIKAFLTTELKMAEAALARSDETTSPTSAEEGEAAAEVPSPTAEIVASSSSASISVSGSGSNGTLTSKATTSISPKLPTSSDFLLGAYDEEDLMGSLCGHGSLPPPSAKAKTWKWRAVRISGAHTILNEICGGDWPILLRTVEDLCERCVAGVPSEAVLAANAAKDSAKRLKLWLRTRFAFLLRHAPGREYAEASLERDRLLCRHCLEAVKDFLHSPKPELPFRLPLCNEHLLCDHGQLRFPLSDAGGFHWSAGGFFLGQSATPAAPFVPLTGEEWELWRETGAAAEKEGLGSLLRVREEAEALEAAGLAKDGVHVDLGVCNDCLNQSFQASAAERFRYRHGRVIVRKVERGSDVEDSTTASFSSESPTAATASTASTSNGVRSSRRLLRAAALPEGSFYAHVHDSARMTIAELKLSLINDLNVLPSEFCLFEGQRRLDEVGEATLEALRIPDGASLRAECDPPQTAAEMEEADRQAARARTPEKGFQGSLLAPATNHPDTNPNAPPPNPNPNPNPNAPPPDTNPNPDPNTSSS